jgi:DNA (cytosine-5)-methyltransferase 1
MRPSGPRKERKTVRFISLFAGIGGFDLGLERAGMQCVGQVEINPFCQRVLAHHWPHVKLVGDIHDVTQSDFGAVDLICGGFPCQPFSHAGKRKGKNDDRYLWPEMLRVIRAYRPAWVLGENVAGIVNMELNNVLVDLEKENYEVESFIIPACAVDAPHERKRVWILAYCPDASDTHCSRFREQRRTESVQQEQPSAQCLGQTIPYPFNDGYNRAEGNEAEPSGDEPENRIFERGNTWEPEPGICRVVNGVPGRVDSLRGLGNAVVPQVVEVIGRAIIKSSLLKG